MLNKLFRRSRPLAQTIERPRRAAASRWSATQPELGRKVRVVAIHRETPDAVTVSIEPVDGRPLDFEAGQYLTHCFTIDGQVQRRAYSLSVPEGEQPVAFTCKRVADGAVSPYVCEQLAVGDEYEVRGPTGEFCLRDESGSAPLLLIAAGSGITPCLSLLETALQRDSQRPVHLVYGSRDEEHIIFAARLQALAAAHDNFRLTHVLSQPGGSWQGEQGHISSERVMQLSAPDHQTEIYVCGPQAMMDELVTGLAASGIPEAQIHREDFRSVNHATAAHPTEVQTIVFRRSGVEVQQQPGQSILDAALANDVALEFSCTVGGCAACKVKVIKGRTTVDEPNCLTPSEQAEGYTLACSAYALEPVELDA